LAPESQECQSFITPDGVFSPKRVLHGTSNAVLHLQAALQGVLKPLAQQILAWLDDLLLHAKSVPTLLGFLRDFFLLCRLHNLKLHPGKCVLFATEVQWCGRLISRAGVRFDPRRAQGLLDLPAPTTGADLQQFVCALNWMRTSIPSFATLIAPLHILLESVYQAAGGKRTKTAAAKVQLHLVGWTSHHADVLAACKESLLHAATLAHPSPDRRLCLYTDASQDYWSSMATQVPPADLELPRSEQRHEPLAFPSGSFTGAMRRWCSRPWQSRRSVQGRDHGHGKPRVAVHQMVLKRDCNGDFR
jgi:RNase H-like domain found in reverse transcriptase